MAEFTLSLMATRGEKFLRNRAWLYTASKFESRAHALPDLRTIPAEKDYVTFVNVCYQAQPAQPTMRKIAARAGGRSAGSALTTHTTPPRSNTATRCRITCGWTSPSTESFGINQTAS